MTFKQLKKQNKELQNKLNLANSIVGKQIKSFDDMCEHYEKQLKVQDRELTRRLIIFHYLENRLNEIIKSDS